MKKPLLYIIIILSFIVSASVMTSCAGKTDDKPTSEDSIATSVTSTEETNSTDKKGTTIYNCRINENGSDDFVFYYNGSELVKIEYKACIRGMPEEIEARNAIKKYTGVTMSYSDNDEYGIVIFTIDIKAGGLSYLKDTNRLFKNVNDLSWTSIKKSMEENGYTCSEKK